MNSAFSAADFGAKGHKELRQQLALRRDASAKTDAAEQICKTRVATQRVEEWMHLHELQHV